MIRQQRGNPRNISFEFADITRLRGENEIDTLFTLREVQDTIKKKLQKDPPGESPINKIIVKQLPESAITQLQWLFSNMLSMEYLQKKFKTAILKLIPKPNTNYKHLINYRLILSMEVT